MNPYQIYQQQQTSSAARIDLLLMLYDKAIGHLRQAQAALAQCDLLAATPPLLEAQLIVYALATGIDPEYGEVPQNMLRLYEYVLHCLSQGEASNVQNALRVLTTLREGLTGIQQQVESIRAVHGLRAILSTCLLFPSMTASALAVIFLHISVPVFSLI
jgi:flagellar secretion chaperone FliS